MISWIELAFAGLWPLVWHFGIGAGLIILCALGAYFLPLARKDFVYAAVVVAAAMFFMAMGTKMEIKRQAAQAAELDKIVSGVVQGTNTPRSKAAADPWDNKGY